MYNTKSELETGLRSFMRDPSSTSQRWSDAEIAAAINVGIAELMPHVGFYVTAPTPLDDSGLYAPAYYMQDQVLHYTGGTLVKTITEVGDSAPGDEVRAWVYNPQFPQGSFALAADLNSGDTSMTVTFDDEFPPAAGHVKIGLEVIRYNGTSSDALGEATLDNIERNQGGTALYSVVAGTPVEFACYLDDNRVRQVVYEKASAYLHQMYTTDASPTQIQDHQWIMRWNTQQVSNFWRSYTPQKEYVRRPMRKVY